MTPELMIKEGINLKLMNLEGDEGGNRKIQQCVLRYVCRNS